MKLIWVQLQRKGKAYTTWRYIHTEFKSSYQGGKAALQQWFEPNCTRELYVVEFYARKCKGREPWGELAGNLRSTADHIFPEFNDKVRDQLACDQFLNLLQEPTLSLAVRQRHPKTLNEPYCSQLKIMCWNCEEDGHFTKACAVRCNQSKDGPTAPVPITESADG